jgi:hypothetical protein
VARSAQVRSLSAEGVATVHGMAAEAANVKANGRDGLRIPSAGKQSMTGS